MLARAPLFVIVAAAGIVRLALAATTPFVYDEYAWTRVADEVSLLPPRLPLHGDQHPPGAAYVAALGAGLLGRNLVGYRLGSVLLGTALVWAAAWLATRAFGPRAGLLAAALVGLNEYLLGISRLATEKCYLGFALLALVAFARALETGRQRHFLAAGALIGLGLLTKHSLVLWLPILAFELRVRGGPGALWRAGPRRAALVALVLTLPDLMWNAVAAAPSTWSERGLAWQLGRFGFGWSHGPLALFLRPVGHLAVESAVSEYASMTVVPGALLLVGAVLSLALLTGREARFLQVLGFAPFLFFSLCGNPRVGVAEFWWADLCVAPFALLSAGVLARLRPALGWSLLACALVPGAIALSVARECCYAATWPAPPASYVERCQENQRAAIVRFRQRDHAAVCRLGPWRLPAARYFVASLTEYQQRLRDGRLGQPSALGGWPYVRPDRVDSEWAWAETQARRLGRR